MLVPVVLFLGCFAAAIVAVDRWLPDLAQGRVGGLAFFTVSGLLGAAAGLVGLHIYEIVRELTLAPNERINNPDIVAVGLETMLRDVGTVVGLAAAVYLLAPPQGKPIDDAPESVQAQAV
ncbi:MAG TPA: hypothetical protein VIC06_09475 [Solirubrobacteraceae bacterium]|jgi:hypothetical protein